MMKKHVKVPKATFIKGQRHTPVFINAEEKRFLRDMRGAPPVMRHGLPAYPPISSSGSGPSVGPGTSRTSSSSLGGGNVSSSVGSRGSGPTTGPASTGGNFAGAATPGGVRTGSTGTSSGSNAGKQSGNTASSPSMSSRGGVSAQGGSIGGRSSGNLGGGPVAGGSNGGLSSGNRSANAATGPSNYGAAARASSPPMSSRGNVSGGTQRVSSTPRSGSANSLGPATYSPGPLTTNNPGYSGPKGVPALGLNTASRYAAARKAGSTVQPVSASPSEIDTLARLMIAESGSIRNPYGLPNTLAMQAVGEVARNRLQSGLFGSTLQSVMTQPKAFSPILDKSINRITSAHPAYADAVNIAKSVLSGESPPIVGSAVNFGNLNTIFGAKSPSSSATKKAFSQLKNNPDTVTFADARNPSIQHTFGTIGQPVQIAGMPGTPATAKPTLTASLGPIARAPMISNPPIPTQKPGIGTRTAGITPTPGPAYKQVADANIPGIVTGALPVEKPNRAPAFAGNMVTGYDAPTPTPARVANTPAWGGSYTRPEFSAFGGMPAAPPAPSSVGMPAWGGSYTRPEFSGLGGMPAASLPSGITRQTPMMSTAAIDRQSYQPSQASAGFRPTSLMGDTGLSAPGTNFTPMSQIDPSQPWQAPSPVNRGLKKDMERVPSQKIADATGGVPDVFGVTDPVPTKEELDRLEREGPNLYPGANPVPGKPSTTTTSISANAATGPTNYSPPADYQMPDRSVYDYNVSKMRDPSRAKYTPKGIDVQEPGQVPGRPTRIVDLNQPGYGTANIPEPPLDQAHPPGFIQRMLPNIIQGGKINRNIVQRAYDEKRGIGGRGSGWQERQADRLFRALMAQGERSGSRRTTSAPIDPFANLLPGQILYQTV